MAMAMAMGMSISTLTSSFSSLSFSSQLPQKPLFLAVSPSLKFSSFSQSKTPKLLTVVASSADIDVDEISSDEPSTTDPETVGVESEEEEIVDLVKYVKSRLPGGFAAQKLWGTGRRKTAVARVILKEGDGKVIINYRYAKDYMQGNPMWILQCKEPLMTLGYEKNYDVFVKAHGGGLSGQAQAIGLGVARALVRESPTLHKPPLKAAGHLTRDSRIVERKKVGLKKARKRPQFSKR